MGTKKREMVAELLELFGKMDGPVALHWEGSDEEPTEYHTLEAALQDVAQAAIDTDRTALEIERMAYIVDSE